MYLSYELIPPKDMIRRGVDFDEDFTVKKLCRHKDLNTYVDFPTQILIGFSAVPSF